MSTEPSATCFRPVPEPPPDTSTVTPLCFFWNSEAACFTSGRSAVEPAAGRAVGAWRTLVRPLPAAVRTTPLQRLVLGFVGGCLLVHLELSLFDLLGWRWSLALVLPPLLVAAAVGLFLARRRPAR